MNIFDDYEDFDAAAKKILKSKDPDKILIALLLIARCIDNLQIRVGNAIDLYYGLN